MCADFLMFLRAKINNLFHCKWESEAEMKKGAKLNQGNCGKKKVVKKVRSAIEKKIYLRRWNMPFCRVGFFFLLLTYVTTWRTRQCSVNSSETPFYKKRKVPANDFCCLRFADNHRAHCYHKTENSYVKTRIAKDNN